MISNLMTTIQIWTAILTFFGQGFVLYFNWKMIQFAKKYGKPWANAFKTFFVAMTICLIRRAIVVAWGFGLDGSTGEAIQWIDHVVLHFLLTGLYIIFLVQLVKWWTGFFNNIDAILGIGVIEQVVAESPIQVKIEGPKKLIVENDKHVIIEDPKIVVLIKPKKIDVVRN